MMALGTVPAAGTAPRKPVTIARRKKVVVLGITSTMQVGIVRDAVVMYADRLGIDDPFQLPVVAETWDGWLSDPSAFPLTPDDAFRALDAASPGAVAEGNVGGGTGMICHEFKGGIGTSSRVIDAPGGRYAVGVLVQANYGLRAELTVNGVPVGKQIDFDAVPSAWDDPEEKGSIIIVVATDAPLIPVQCTRLARRATAGLARVGGIGRNGSGDLFLAFSTGNHVSKPGKELYELKMLPHPAMSDVFRATVDAVEESILNALCAAETMTGYRGRTAHALPLDTLAKLVAR